MRKHLTIISHNINGGFHNKIADIANLAEHYDADFFFMQEVHLIQHKFHPKFIPLNNYTYEYNILTNKMAESKYVKNKKEKIRRKFKDYPEEIKKQFDNIDKSKFKPSEGTMVLINKRWYGKYSIIKHKKRRYILIILELETERYFLLNLYAPTGVLVKQKEKANKFMVKITEFMKQQILKKNNSAGKKITHIIMAGDYNMVPKANLDRERSLAQAYQINTKNASLNKLITDLNMIDTYRFLHRQRKQYTFRRLAKIDTKKISSNSFEPIYLSRARIDLFLTKRSMVQNIKMCDIIKKCIYNSDHSPIIIKYKILRMKALSRKENNVIHNPRLKTKEQGIVKLKEIGLTFQFNDTVIQNQQRWIKEKNKNEKIKIRNNTLESITKNMFEFFSETIGLTRARKGKLSWSQQAINDPESKKLKIGRKKCDRALKVINKHFLYGTGRVKKIINRVNGLQIYWDKIFPNSDYFFMWLDSNKKNNVDIIRHIKTLRNFLVRTLRKLLRIYRQKKIAQCVNRYIDNYTSQKKKFFSKILPKNKNYTQMEVLQNPDNPDEVTTSEKKKLKWIKNYFNEKVYKSRINMQQIPTWLLNKKNAKLGKQHLVCVITEKELQEAIVHLKNFTAAGDDGIPPELFEAIWQNKTIRPLILKCYNSCLQSKSIPNKWKMANIFLIPKKENPINLDFFRPISLLNAQHKIFTQILTRRLSKFMESNKFLSPSQQGSRKKCSTFNHINSLINIFRDRKESGKDGNKKDICVTFLDIRKAFDSIEFSVIKQTLIYYDIPLPFIDMLMNIYKDNKAKVLTPFGITEEINIQRGVRQGDVLSPLLFIMVLNPLLEMVIEKNLGYNMVGIDGINEVISILAYVDDMVLLTSNRQQMLDILGLVKKFLDTYGIQINYSKTKYSSTYKNDTDILLNNNTIKYISPNTSYRYLGILINLNLSWQKDQKKAVNNFKYNLNRIRYQRYSPDIKVEVINRILFPGLEYHMCIYIFSNIQRKIIKNSLKSVARYWFSIPRHIKNEYIWLEKKYAGIGILNANAFNFAVFMQNFKKNCLNKEPCLPQKTTQILIKKNLLLRKNNHHLMNINFQQNKQCQKFNILDSSIKSFMKLIYKFKLAIKHSWRFSNRLEYFLPPNLFKRIKPNMIKTFGSTDCSHFSNNFGILKKKVSRCLTTYQKKLLYPFITIAGTHMVKKHIGNISTEMRDVFPMPRINILRDHLNNYYIERNTQMFFLSSNITYVNNEIWAWSDGSGDGFRYGWGVWFSNNSILNNKGRTYLIHSVFEGEMMAMEYILSIVPHNIKLRLFIDCQSAIDVLDINNNSREKKINEKIHRYIIRRINSLLKQRMTNTVFQKVRSHYKEKLMAAKNNDRNLYNKIKAEIAKLKNVYGQNFNLVMKGNEAADSLAKQSLNLPSSNFHKCGGMDDYTIYKPLLDINGNYMNMMGHETGMPVVDPIRKQILYMYQEKYKKKWKVNRNKRWNNQYINFKMTTEILCNKSIDINLFKYKKFLIRILNKSLATSANLFSYASFLKGKKNEGKKLTLRQEYKIKIYNTNICTLCKEKENIFHISSNCIHNSNLQSQKIEQIQNTLDKNINTKCVKIKYWLTKQSHNNIPMSKRKVHNKNSKLLNVGILTNKFTQEITSKIHDKDDAIKMLSNIQWIILGYDWLMYRNSLRIFFNSLKRNKLYVNKFHNKQKTGIT